MSVIGLLQPEQGCQVSIRIFFIIFWFGLNLISDCSLNMNSSSPVKLWRAQRGDLDWWPCPVTLIQQWICTFFSNFLLDFYYFPQMLCENIRGSVHKCACENSFSHICVDGLCQEASVWCWRDVSTPVSGNERGLGAAAVTQSAGQCFHLDLYYSRLDEPRPGVGLLKKHRWSEERGRVPGEISVLRWSGNYSNPPQHVNYDGCEFKSMCFKPGWGSKGP